MGLMKHLIFIYDMTEQDFSLGTTAVMFLSSKNPSPSLQCQLGTSKNSGSTKNLRNTQRKTRSTGTAFSDTQFNFLFPLR